MTAAPPPVQSWINKRQADRPSWVQAVMVTARPEPNGTFLLRTKRGQQRVHVGYMVIERKGDVYAVHPEEARALVAELDEAELGGGHLNAIDREAARASGHRRAEADVADRTDDTDDITRRIQRGEPVRIVKEEIGDKSQISAIKPRESIGKEISPKQARYAAPVGSPPSLEFRPVVELKIDDSYQRSIDTGPSRALIERIARAWDWRMCLPLVVSKRADGLYVIDGQHRLAAARKRKDLQHLPCLVVVFDTIADEAAMFVAMNRARRAMNRLDDFHAAQASGNEEALAVTALIEGAGFTVSRKTGSSAWAPGEVAFTSAIAKVRRRSGEAIARDALKIMSEAFPGQRLAAGSSIFSAISAVLADRPTNFDYDQLVRAVKTYDMAGWASFLDQSRGGTDRAKALREMLLAAYDDAGKAAAA